MMHFTLMAAMVLLSGTSVASTQEWNFRVLLDQHEIGTHRYVLNSTADGYSLQSEAAFDYRILFFSVYRYDHHDVEYWRGDCLKSLSSSTTTNGKYESVTAQLSDDGLLVKHNDQQADYNGCIKSFAYWDLNTLKETQLLNSQTGEYLSISVSRMGDETVDVQGSRQQAEHYRITGKELSIDLWYVQRKWVGLQAAASGGHVLQYVLR